MAVFGIDLGTTNSLIGLYADGSLSDLVPSCVNLETGVVGVDAYEDMNAKRSFKVDISMGVEGAMPRVASSHVLRKLKKIAGDTNVRDVVISVPAYFSDNQRQATMEAARQAGLNVMGLVNEPTAAAMYIAQDRRSLFVVFDLGGGTFDVSIIDARFGTYDVQATDGRIIGGDNFDKAIMAHFAKVGNIPLHKLSSIQRAELQHFATKMKLQMQKVRTDFEVDLTTYGGDKIMFTEDNYRQLMKLIFGDCITLLQRMITAHILDVERYDILLVGGSTRCPYLREWIASVTGKKLPPMNYDPDKVVAQGAALYAHIMDTDDIDAKVSDVTKTLSIEMADGTCDIIVDANSKIPLSTEKLLCNSTDCSELRVNLLQGDSLFAKDNECIGTLIWDYGEVMEAMTGNVFVTVDIDNKGVITLSVRELLKEPVTVVLERYNAVVK